MNFKSFFLDYFFALADVADNANVSLFSQIKSSEAKPFEQ